MKADRRGSYGHLGANSALPLSQELVFWSLVSNAFPHVRPTLGT